MCLCAGLCIQMSRCSQSPGEDIRFPGTSIVSSCGLPKVGARIVLRFSARKQIVLTTGQSSHPYVLATFVSTEINWSYQG